MSIEIITATIALLVAIITFGQWLTSRNQLKIELFEKRYEQYQKITAFLANTLINGRVLPGSDIELLRDTKNAHFIFAGDENVKQLIARIYERAVNLHALETTENGLVGDALKRNLDRQTEIKNWMQTTLNSMEKHFEKHLLLKH